MEMTTGMRGRWTSKSCYGTRKHITTTSHIREQAYFVSYKTLMRECVYLDFSCIYKYVEFLKI